MSALRNDSFAGVNMSAYDELLAPIFKLTHDLEKHPEGGTFDAVVHLQRKLYYAIASNTRCIRTICEIGFNSGSSALIWLHANPTANVVMFDLWTHKYSPAAEAYLRTLPQLNATQRLTIVKGSSLQTVPEFARNASGTGFVCDLLSVDGSHKHQDAVDDIANMMAIANPQWNALFVDDTNCGYKYCVDAACNEHVSRGNIRKLKGLSMADGTRGASLFHYIHNANAKNRTT